MTSLKSLPWHPLLLSFFYVLAIYQTNVEHHPAHVIWLPALFAFAVSILFAALGALTCRNLREGALISSALVVVLLIHPFLQEKVEEVAGLDFGTGLFLLLVIGAGVVFFALGRERRRSESLTRSCNFVGLCCLVLPIIMITTSSLGIAIGRAIGEDTPYFPEWEIRGEIAEDKVSVAPDIYHIVMDGYARNDILNRLYAFDNSEFLDEFRAMGFYVAEDARANYCQTGLSMSSSLNCHYLDLPQHLIGSDERRTLEALFHQNSVGFLLRKVGYQLRLFDSGYYLTDSMSGAEVIDSSNSLWNEFSYEVVRRSTQWLPPQLKMTFLADLGDESLQREHRMRVLSAFDFLENASPPSEKPSYTFVHILTPHPPFTFADDRLRETRLLPYSVFDGSHRVDRLLGGSEEYQRLYVSQLKIVNQMALKSVTQLISNSKRPLVIVLQSDHGPGSKLDWEEIQKSDPEERLGILSAFYFSNQDYSALYQDISPINIWRVVLNSFILQNELPLLEDRSFLSSWTEPLLFYEYRVRFPE